MQLSVPFLRLSIFLIWRWQRIFGSFWPVKREGARRNTFTLPCYQSQSNEDHNPHTGVETFWSYKFNNRVISHISHRLQRKSGTRFWIDASLSHFLVVQVSPNHFFALGHFAAQVMADSESQCFFVKIIGLLVWILSKNIGMVTILVRLLSITKEKKGLPNLRRISTLKKKEIVI